MNDRSTRDKQMAAYLRSKGIYHGVRQSKTQATHNYPSPLAPAGSAKYHRYMESRQTYRRSR